MKLVNLQAPPYPEISSKDLSSCESIYSERIIDDYYFNGATKFETALSEYLRVQYSFATNSGYSAIVLALLAAGVKAGDEVIVPAISWGQTVSPVLHIGAKPVFADINKDTFQISYEEVVNCFTDKTKAVLVVNLYGSSPELYKIKRFCENNMIFMIEDSAQSMGCKFNGEHTGTIGHFGAFSFNAEKLLAVGGSGAITCESRHLYEKVIYFGSKSLHKRYILKDTNYDCTDAFDYTFLCHPVLQQLCHNKLETLDELNYYRRENVKFMRDELSDIKHLKLQTIHPQSDLPLYMFSFVNLANISQDKLFSLFRKFRVPVFGYNPVPLNEMRSNRFSWAANTFSNKTCTNASYLSKNEVCITSYKWYTKRKDYLKQYSDAIHKCYEQLERRGFGV